MKCHHGADKFIERYFYDCVYKCAVRLQSALPPAQPAAEPMLPLCAAPETTWGSSWVLQPSCYGFWLRCVGHAVSHEVPTLQLRLPLTGCSCLQLPQFITNYKNKSAEALSPWFLAQWLLVGGAAAAAPAGPPCVLACGRTLLVRPTADCCQHRLYAANHWLSPYGATPCFACILSCLLHTVLACCRATHSTCWVAWCKGSSCPPPPTPPCECSLMQQPLPAFPSFFAALAAPQVTAATLYNSSSSSSSSSS
jgi:hypothetical protein